MSANRKYTQLTVDDIHALRKFVNMSYDRPLQYDKLRAALRELQDLADDTPDARICLAHAAVRASGPRRVFASTEATDSSTELKPQE